MSWNCSACTFLNDSEALSCSICGTLKPTENSSWSCSACTFNNTSSTVCDMCGTEKPQEQPKTKVEPKRRGVKSKPEPEVDIDETFSQKGVIECTGTPTGLENFTKDQSLTITHGLQLSTSGYYNNWGTAKGNVNVTKGVWYFETTISNRNYCRIGWCTSHYNPQPGLAIGSDEESWGIDQSKKYHKDEGGQAFGENWVNGDAIGTMLDLDRRCVSYYRNGRDIGVAFQNIPKGSTLSPAFSVSYNTKITVNFGPQFRYKPVGAFGLNPTLKTSQKRALQEIFSKYDPEGEDVIYDQCFANLLTDFGLTDPQSDPLPIIISWKFKAREQWTFHKDEWMTTWSLTEAFSINDMKERIKSWREELKDDSAFRNFYSFIFDYLKPEAATVLEASEAVGAWKMCQLNKGWTYWNIWEKYWTEGKLKGISKDTWLMLLRFIKTLGNDVSNYSEDDCWPSVIDDFVCDWLKKDG